MINQQLLDFIKAQLLKGVDRETIMKELMENGLTREDIEEGFSLANARIINLTGNSSSPIPPTIDVESYNKGKKIKYTIISSIITIGIAIGLIFGDEIVLVKDEFIRSIKGNKIEIINQIRKLVYNTPITTSLSPNYLEFDEEKYFRCDLNNKEYTTLIDYNSYCVSDSYSEEVTDELNINILKPQNDSVVKLGEKYNIIWDTSKINASRVYIRIRNDQFGICKSMHVCYNFEELGIVDNTGTFIWDTAKFPFKPGDKYKIKIDASDYKNSIYSQGLSKGYFSIVLPDVVEYCPTGKDFYDSDYPNCLCPETSDNLIKSNALKLKGTNSVTHMPLYEIIPDMYFCKSLNDLNG
jgi:hypothetical protein